ncbi:CPBP family intramembrane glutamic endopeptidase [Phytohabitans rumicis]|uniref:CAAX prenyl protease 2/Lysostaphin resistance protein A-like domain-containing protein n=1 Tax=Phytohabitans rumicis TaxID=1076125 RepID=A0A6V8KX48_9ACTN|nr:CPBP family intramembrane glutamic endopeptidase [Phytohabitans rumicis]GFJ86416.1 hypothetical protein Prum_000580 [Phytohabitans rumicis]
MAVVPAATASQRSWLRLGYAVALLAAVNVVNNRLTGSSTPLRAVEVLLLLAFARGCGLSPAELGLARSSWTRGLRWAAVVAVLVAVAYAVALALPPTRPVFLDRRADFSVGVAVLQAAGPVLVGTVLLEELAFRGLLWGMLRRLRGATFATLVSSALFGLWHVLPAWNLVVHNRAAADVLGTGVPSRLAAVALGVAFTAAAGVVLCELRRRSGSLLAPIGLHWATNGMAYVLAAIAWTL